MQKGEAVLICETKRDVLLYLNFLSSQNFNVTVHVINGEFFNKYFKQLIDFNLHDNPYCFALKSDEELKVLCSECEARVYERLSSEGAFFGMCHAGVESFTFPIKYSGNVVGFISVGGYGRGADLAGGKIRRICEKSCLDLSVMENIYDTGLNKNIPDFEYVRTLIKPLCHMLAKLYELFMRNESYNEGIDIYAIALSYIRHNYFQSITLESIAKVCKCSPSTLSHLFKKRNGTTLKSYINSLRLNEAKTLLLDTSLPISGISEMLGFSDSNYFTNLFKKEFGFAPTEYRKEKMVKKLI